MWDQHDPPSAARAASVEVDSNGFVSIPRSGTVCFLLFPVLCGCDGDFAGRGESGCAPLGFGDHLFGDHAVKDALGECLGVQLDVADELDGSG